MWVCSHSHRVHRVSPYGTQANGPADPSLHPPPQALPAPPVICPSRPLPPDPPRSLKLWGLYVDLEESLGTIESTRGVYDRIMEHRIATPQIVLNYALYLQVPVQRREGLGNLQVQWSYWVIGISYRYTSFFRFCFRFRGGGVSRKDSVGVKERVLAHPLPPPSTPLPSPLFCGGEREGARPSAAAPPQRPSLSSLLCCRRTSSGRTPSRCTSAAWRCSSTPTSRRSGRRT